MTTYLDIWELGELLGKAPDTIRRQLRSDPRSVPPRMHIPGTKMLRWRKGEVDTWLYEQGALNETQMLSVAD
jgi:predicted DNA-binding transcriptional regulator AlpA